MHATFFRYLCGHSAQQQTYVAPNTRGGTVSLSDPMQYEHEYYIFGMCLLRPLNFEHTMHNISTTRIQV